MPVVRGALIGLGLVLVPAPAGATPICVSVAGAGLVDTGTVVSPCLPYDGETTCLPVTYGPDEVEMATLTVCRPAPPPAQQSKTT